jgi:hypothetical protein
MAVRATLVLAGTRGTREGQGHTLADLEHPLGRRLREQLVVEQVEEDVEALLRVVDNLGLLRLRKGAVRRQHTDQTTPQREHSAHRSVLPQPAELLRQDVDDGLELRCDMAAVAGSWNVAKEGSTGSADKGLEPDARYFIFGGSERGGGGAGDEFDADGGVA